MHYARMAGHDYHEGYYFVTINTAPRRNCLSRIVCGKVELLPPGEIVLKAYLQMGADSPEIDLRVCAIMPDHFHAIIVFRRRSEHPLGWHVRRFKARATRAVRGLSGDASLGLFEENFHGFISFSSEELDSYVQYVKLNPIRWQWKHDHPDFFSKHFIRACRAAFHGRPLAIGRFSTRPGLSRWLFIGALRKKNARPR